MAKITLVTDNCKYQTSPKCPGEFSYVRKPGRPPVACAACRTHKPARDVANSERPTEGTCGCGQKFIIQPRGRISNRCETCRANGTVWRTGDEGEILRIQASQIAQEEQEKKEAAGLERAIALTERMRPLLEKRNREVIVH